jgi:hypothetical protein
MNADFQLERAIDWLYEAQANLCLSEKRGTTKRAREKYRRAAKRCLSRGVSAGFTVLKKLMK